MSLRNDVAECIKAYMSPPYGREVDGTVDLLEKIYARLDIIEYRDDVNRRCLYQYGARSQMDMAIEEMSELTKALLKYRRLEADPGVRMDKARDDIIDEIADVRIMCRQMEILFSAVDEVEKRIDFKTNRQKNRLDA